jgi:glutaminyl-peptide cyclotransferase
MVRWAGGVFLCAVFVLAAVAVPRPSAAGVFSQEPPRDKFADDRPEPAPLDAERSMDYLKAVCKLGPRVSGSEGMKKQQALLEKHFTKRGGKVEWQKFTARQRSQREPVEMANLIVRWHPDRRRRVILCAHYDTRPLADQEPDPRKWREPFLGANDGGSGVALLMEMAHHVKDIKTSVGVDLVLFDGEEFIYKSGDDYFFGSKHFAAEHRRSRPTFAYAAAVLVDMVGGKGARFPIEVNSWFSAAPLVQEVWTAAADLGCEAFVNREGPRVDDDHLALNRAGIPAINIIDLSYRHWHRLSDVPENCSGESLAQVGRVLSVWLQRTK